MKGLKEKGKIYLEILSGRVIDIDTVKITRYGVSYIKKIYRLQNL